MAGEDGAGRAGGERRLTVTTSAGRGPSDPAPAGDPRDAVTSPASMATCRARLAVGRVVPAIEREILLCHRDGAAPVQLVQLEQSLEDPLVGREEERVRVEVGEAPDLAGQVVDQQILHRGMSLPQVGELLAGQDERLRGLESDDRGHAPLARLEERLLAEALAPPEHGHRRDIAAAAGDPDGHPPARDVVEGVPDVVLVEHDLAAPVATAGAGGQDRSTIRVVEPSQDLELHLVNLDPDREQRSQGHCPGSAADRSRTDLAVPARCLRSAPRRRQRRRRRGRARGSRPGGGRGPGSGVTPRSAGGPRCRRPARPVAALGSRGHGRARRWPSVSSMSSVSSVVSSCSLIRLIPSQWIGVMCSSCVERQLGSVPRATPVV